MSSKNIRIGVLISATLISVSAIGAEAQRRKNDKERADAEESRAWYILRQTDSDGLLHGLPQRLGKAIVPSKRQTPMWQGVDDAGSIDLEIKVEGDVTGEIFVGFFSDVRWWLAPPVQVRRFPGPRRYTVERLMPGKYYVGAMIGSLPRPEAFGVHRNWPGPVQIKAGKTMSVELLVSTDFEDRVCHPFSYEGFAGQFGTLDPTRLITVRTVDHRSNPAPFCRVTYRDHDRSSHYSFHDIGTDEQGYSYCGAIDGQFSLTAARYDFLPESFAQLWQFRRFEEIHNTAGREKITVQWPPYPTGTAKVKGRVHDQHGQSLKQYYLTLKHTEKGQRLDSEDWFAIGYKVPVTDPDGRFEIDHLPPGEFRWMVRSFDYPAYAYNFDMGRFIISEEDNAVTELDLEIEAKELLYGRAVYEDGAPVHPGMHIARFGEDDYFALNTEKDGSFRVCLSKKEGEDLLENRGGMVEIQGKTGEKWHTLGQVHIDRLSKEPNNPARIVVPRPMVEHSATDAGEKTELPGRAGAVAEGTSSSQTNRPTIEPFELTDTGGHTHRLPDYKGKVVLLNIFATWCGPCEMERPHLVKLHSELSDKGLVILAISRKEKPEVVESWVRKNRPPFPVLVDETGRFTKQFAYESKRVPVPTNVLLDRQHTIAKKSTGFSKEKFADITAVIDELLGRDE